MRHYDKNKIIDMEDNGNIVEKKPYDNKKGNFITKIAKDMRIEGYDNFDDWKYITRRLREKLEIKTTKKKKKLPSYLSDTELDTVFDVAYKLQTKKNSRKDTPKYGLIIETAFKTGMRNSEVCNLRIENCDFTNGTFRVIEGKGKKDRDGVMAKSLIRLLLTHIGTRTSGYVFLSNRGNKYSTRQVQRIVEKIKDVSGIQKEITPHIFRHTFATILLKEGMSIKDIQMLLGHENLETTSIYTHIELEMLKKPVMEIMDRR
jgi:integrase/recombinase XerD